LFVALSEFVATLGNRHTRRVYAFAVRNAFGDVDSFLALDPAGKESFLLQ
jgi:hypothetical protein